MADDQQAPERVPVNHKPITPPWVSFELEDGSIVKLKFVPAQFWRMTAPDGQTLYQVDGQQVFNVILPPTSGGKLDS